MTIEEMKVKRMQLAADISELLNKFQQETGCCVDRLDLRTFNDMEGPVSTEVTVKIAID